MKFGNRFLQSALKFLIFQTRTQQQPSIQQSLTRQSTRARAPAAVVYDLDDSD